VTRVVISGVDAALRPIQIRLVCDVTQHAGFGAGSEQSALGTLQYLDALEIGGIHVEIAAGHGNGLIVKISRHPGKAPDAARSLCTG
jgi:hypothetical protein